MKAMILAAGFGTRLFPLTIDRTKPAIPFLGKPLVGYVAEYVAKFGFRDVIVNLHHQPDSVKHALGDGSEYGVNIEYTLESPNILGTAGALDNARALLSGDTFIIVNGKIITDIDISAAVETHRKSGAIATMVLKPNVKRERFTTVEVRDSIVTGFGDFAHPFTKEEIRDTENEADVPLMFTGIHILEPEVFEYIPRGIYSDIVPTFYSKAFDAGTAIAAHITDANWYELSTIPRYLDISLAMMKETNVFIGTGGRISPSSSIRDSVLWDNIEITNDVSLYRTIIADGVKIRRQPTMKMRQLFGRKWCETVQEYPEKALKGYIEGENYIVPLN